MAPGLSSPSRVSVSPYASRPCQNWSGKVMFQKVPRALVKEAGVCWSQGTDSSAHHPPRPPESRPWGRPGLLRLCGEGTVTYHEAGPRLGGGHLVRSGDLAGDQSLEFLQLLEQSPEGGTAVTRGLCPSRLASLPPGALPRAGWGWGPWAGSRLGFHTRGPLHSRQKRSLPAWLLCGVAGAPGARFTVHSWVTLWEASSGQSRGWRRV